MKTQARKSKALLACAALFASLAFAHSQPLKLEPAIIVPDSKGGFDYLQVDDANRRLLANHTGNQTLDVFDVDSGKLIKKIPTGKAQGVAVDKEAGKYYVSVSEQKKIVFIDSKTLEKTAEVPLDGPADALVFDPKNHCLYVGHDDEKALWVVDTKTAKVTATIKIAAGPEYVLYDPETDRIFQNIKSNDSLLVIDPTSNTIKETWKTAPAKNPHGLAYNPKTKRLFCAGTNGKLAIIDASSGSLVTSTSIVNGVDQIAFDPEKNRIYCPSGGGSLSILEETKDGVNDLGVVKTARGAKTITFDPKTHAVWIAYADKDHSYIRKLTPQ
jgi:YVTN family beta-propeller protein